MVPHLGLHELQEPGLLQHLPGLSWIQGFAGHDRLEGQEEVAVHASHDVAQAGVVLERLGQLGPGVSLTRRIKATQVVNLGEMRAAKGRGLKADPNGGSFHPQWR